MVTRQPFGVALFVELNKKSVLNLCIYTNCFIFKKILKFRCEEFDVFTSNK